MLDRVNGTNNKFPKSIFGFSILPSLHLNTLFFMNTTKNLNLTSEPVCNSQNHTAMTIHVPYLCVLISHSYWSSGHLVLLFDINYYSDLYPASFSSIFLINLVYIPPHGAALIALSFQTLLVGSRGKACRQCYEV